MVGQADVVVPQNLAAAANYNCIDCLTYALASQLVITLDGPLSEEGRAELDELWQEIVAFAETIRDVPLDELQSRLTEYRRQIAEIYPALSDVTITHSWGGTVGITLPRMPFVREVMPGVTSIGGYSGHGVMLAKYCGRLYAESVLGGSNDLDLIRALDIPAFPGGTRLRAPLLFLALTWFALRDRF